MLSFSFFFLRKSLSRSMADDVTMLSFKASGAGVATFSVEIFSVTFSSVAIYSISADFFSAGSEGPVSVPASIIAASTSICLVSALVCALSASATFFMGAGLMESVVSKISHTFTILFLLGVMAELFSAFNTVASVEGLKISGIFVTPSVFDHLALSLSTFVSTSSTEGAFGITADSSTFCVGEAGSFGSAAEEALPPNSDTTAGSI
jgi:hypothetical protein